MTKWNVIFFLSLFAFGGLASNRALSANPKTFEQAVKTFQVRFEPAEAKPGETVTLKITLEPVRGFHTYPTKQPNPRVADQINRFQFPNDGPVIFVGDLKDPPGAHDELDPAENVEKLVYTGSATWERTAVVSPDAKPGEVSIQLHTLQTSKTNPNKVAYIESKLSVCNKDFCFYKNSLSIALTILPGPAVEVDPKYKAEVEKALASAGQPKIEPPVAPTSPTEAPTKEVSLRISSDRDYAADVETVKAMLPKFEANNAGFVAFVLTAMFWGLVTLLTPCVFPMVPITVSYFIKQGEKKQHNPLLMALVYTFTIIAVLGTAALFFCVLFATSQLTPI